MKLMATGNTAEVFEYDEGKVCKLFKDGYPLDSIKREFENTLLMNTASINTPKAYEIIEHDGRHGIVFEKITGVDLMSEFLKNPEDKNLAARTIENLSKLQKELLSSESKNGISYKDYLRYFGFEKADHLPDGKNICHGDLHPGNIIRTPENKFYLIDFMNVCLGPKEYDVARTYVLLTENNPAAKETGEIYLSLMGMSFVQIEPYLEAIYFCRKKEML